MANDMTGMFLCEYRIYMENDVRKVPTGNERFITKATLDGNKLHSNKTKVITLVIYSLDKHYHKIHFIVHVSASFLPRLIACRRPT